ncbi:MAG TPA: PLP-dependent aspartate aminotransferase family protein [Dongiaceae bacterium]|nr:PLP-dependent aspartate aminotransferase family protein [Dongiaceae bacterium]
MTRKNDAWSPATLAAQALGEIDSTTGALIPPIHTATTYERDPDNEYRKGWSYSRSGNPSYQPAEALLTALEGGTETLLFASGLAAATAVVMALRPGDHIVAPSVMYWSLRNWLLGPAVEWGLAVELVDMTDLSAVEKAVRPGCTKLVWVETPANPLWRVTDIAAVAKLAHAAGAKLAVDSTCATPVLTRPLEHGADIVMHSATKYLNGHSDVIAGTVTTAVQDAFWQRIAAIRTQSGGVVGPFEAWLLQRGMRTLFLRVREASASALRIAHHFQHHPKLAEVLYPGLPDHPDHAVAQRQMTGGFGGMLSIRLAGTDAEAQQAAIACAAKVQLWKRATSLGGVESLIEHRASIEGADSPVPPGLLRLSVGIENCDDLIADLGSALES